MSNYKAAAWNVALESTKSINEMEEKVAQELYGLPYSELSYEEKEEVTFEAYDRLNG